MKLLIQKFMLILLFKGVKDCFFITFNNTDNCGNKVKRNSHKKDFFQE